MEGARYLAIVTQCSSVTGTAGTPSAEPTSAKTFGPTIGSPLGPSIVSLLGPTIDSPLGPTTDSPPWTLVYSFGNGKYPDRAAIQHAIP